MQRNTLFAVACVVGVLAIVSIGLVLGITLTRKEPDSPDPSGSDIGDIVKLINSRKKGNNQSTEKIFIVFIRLMIYSVSRHFLPSEYLSDYQYFYQKKKASLSTTNAVFLNLKQFLFLQHDIFWFFHHFWT